MKKYLYIPILFTATFTTLLSCIKEDLSNCPERPEVKITFECINPDYTFPDIVNEAALLFYNEQKELAYDLKYTKDQLSENNWAVFPREEGVSPGTYTLVAHINYNTPTLTNVTGKEHLHLLTTEIPYTPHYVVNYPVTDTYHGTHTLELDDRSGEKEYKILLSKNTNCIRLIVEFDSDQQAAQVEDFASSIRGANARYQWDNTAPPHPAVQYTPLTTTFGDGQPLITDSLKTMRIWTEADLTLHMQFHANDSPYSHSIPIPRALAAIVDEEGYHPYDTDLKLEYHDFFTFRVKYSETFVVVEVTIDDWYHIDDSHNLW